MSVRPVIGMVACTRRMGAEYAQAVIERYIAAARDYADCDVLIVPGVAKARDLSGSAARLDGVLLTGSPSNMSPARYGEDTAGEGPFDPARDETSLALIEAMLDGQKPVFGICRGYQELNVAFGGTLMREASARGRALQHHAASDVAFAAQFEHRHDVTLSPGGVLHQALGSDRIAVNSVHYQGVAVLGEGLRVEAQADDGLIEAFSACPGGAPVLGVQWHPEWRTGEYPASISFYRLFGEALRGRRDLWRVEGAGHANA